MSFVDRLNTNASRTRECDQRIQMEANSTTPLGGVQPTHDNGTTPVSKSSSAVVRVPAWSVGPVWASVCDLCSTTKINRSSAPNWLCMLLLPCLCTSVNRLGFCTNIDIDTPKRRVARKYP